MLPENETKTFLGEEYSWSKVIVRLEDGQGLYGGVRVWLPKWGPAFVTRMGGNGRETKYKVSVSIAERKQFIRLCIEQNFVTIAPDDRLGVPDEARPSITLTNSKGKTHTISKWAGVQDARFEAIYQPLLEIADRTDGLKPIPKRFTPGQKVAFWVGIVGLIILPFVVGFLLGRTAVTLWWPDNLNVLVSLLILLIIAFPLLMFVLRWFERRKAAYDRLFTNSWLLVILSAIYFSLLISTPGFLKRVSLVVWADTAVGTIQTLNQTIFTDDNGTMDIYNVRYRFQTADGRDYEEQVAVNRDTFSEFEEGDSVTVSYLPFFPRYSLLEYNLTAEMADYALLLFTAVFALYLFLLETALVAPTIYRIQDERL